MHSFFDRLRRKIFESRHFLGTIAQDARETHSLVREINKHAWEKSEPFQRHLDFLDHPAATDIESPLPKLHHDLSVVSSLLEPEIYEVDKNAPSVCLIAIGEEYREAMAPCLAAARAYCVRNGYNYLLLKEKPLQFQRHLYWLKIPLLWRALEMGFSRVFYLDTDAFITNPSVKLEPFFQKLEASGRQILITRDENGVNCGIYFLKENLKSRVLLNLLWEHRSYSYSWHDFGDQSAFHDLLNRYPQLEKLFLLADQRDFNSYIVGGPASLWQKGDFILHFAGVKKAKMNEFIRQHQGDAAR